MNEQTSKLIEQLANKLGTTTEYLWGVLLKQAQIQSVITLLQFLIIGLFGYVLYRIHKSLSIKKEYDGYKETGYSHYEEKVGIPMVIGVVIFSFLSICAFFCIEDVFNGFFNPEYWALQKVLRAVK
jgi:hypothetical protein